MALHSSHSSFSFSTQLVQMENEKRALENDEEGRKKHHQTNEDDNWKLKVFSSMWRLKIFFMKILAQLSLQCVEMCCECQFSSFKCEQFSSFPYTQSLCIALEWASLVVLLKNWTAENIFLHSKKVSHFSTRIDGDEGVHGRTMQQSSQLK